MKKNKKFQDDLKEIEETLKKKLSNNWNHVRKAFLDLDMDQDGYVTSEDLAKLLKNANVISSSTGESKVINFTLLELLIKLRCKQDSTRINYNSFCSWLGQSVEPIEAFYFRHDSNKNPHYEQALKLSIEPNLEQTKMVRKILTGNLSNLKEMFVRKIKLQFKTLKKAFYELDRHRHGHVTFDKFQVIISDWGFEAKESQVRSLFNWLDYDKD